MDEETWSGWYASKADTVEPEIFALARRARDLADGRVLDAGCGAGRHVAYLARMGLRVCGVDQFATAIGKAKGLLASEGLSADLRVLDLKEPLPFADGTFALVISTRAVHHMRCPEVSRAVRELVRVLAPEGLLFLQVPSMEDEEKFLSGGGSEDRRVRFVDAHTVIPETGPEAGVPHHYFTRWELSGLLAGCEIEDLHGKSGHYRGYCVTAKKISERARNVEIPEPQIS